MLVWNAISSITLIILEILSLADLISSIDVTIRSRFWFTASICNETSITLWAAAREFSEFRLVIEPISWLEAEASSMEAACSEAPEAKVFAADATSPEAEASPSACFRS
jgi:hypothetical protein